MAIYFLNQSPFVAVENKTIQEVWNASPND